MKTLSNKGFSTISTALLVSFLLGLGGIGAGGTIVYKKVHPEDFHNQLKAVLGEPLATIFGLTPNSVEASYDTPTPTGTQTSTPTPTPIPLDITNTPTPELTVTPSPIPLKFHINRIGEEISSEQELDDDHGEHGIGSTGITTGVFSEKRGVDHE